MNLLEPIPVFDFKMPLIENTPERSNRNLVFLRHDHSIDIQVELPGEFQVAAKLAHASSPATSTSISRTCGRRVACGGSKQSSRASFKFAKASSSVSPWLATSSSRHCATYQSASLHTLAANGRFIPKFWHKSNRRPKLARRKRDTRPLCPKLAATSKSCY
jgi:hypothetical protein